MKSSWCPPHPFSNDSQKKLRPGSLSSGQPFSLHPGPCAIFFAPKIPTLSYGWNPPPPPPFCDVLPVETVWTFWALALSITEVWNIFCYKHPKCFIIHMFIECFFENAFIHLIQNKPPLGRTGHFWDPCLGMADSNQSPQKQTKQEKTTINMWRKIYSGTTKSSWIIMNLIPNPKNPNLENLFLKHMRNSVQVRPMPLRSGSGLRISEVSPLCTKHACSTVEPPSQWSEKNSTKTLVILKLRKSSWMIWVFILGVFMVLHGFTWMIYEQTVFFFNSLEWFFIVPLVGKLWRGFAFVSYLPSNQREIRNQDDSLHSLSKTQRADHAKSDSVGFLGCLFHVYLKTEMVARFAASLLGVFLANGGCVGFMCWIICKHKWAKCKRNEFGLCIWVWSVGYDALPWKIRDLNTVLGLKLSKSVFQNANRHALDPFSSDS